MEDSESTGTPPLPAVEQPTGWRYFVGTWSGRLLLINAAVFIYICVKSGSVLLPDTESLILLGAKDPVRLAHGELWRVFTPMFIHIGILHFALNSYFLYVMGYQLERILGGPWYLLTYLAAGIAGNIASSVFSVNLSAGASSSLFGLLGAGFFLESTIGRRIRQTTGRRTRTRQRAYAMTLAINLAFGFLVPYIDNSAHLGGLAAGLIVTFAMINLRPNALQPRRLAVGVVALVALAIACAGGLYLGSSPKYVARHLIAAADASDDQEQRIYHYSEALDIQPDNVDVRLKRAREFFATGEANYAFHDVRSILAKGHGADPDLQKLAEELEAKGRQSDAWELRRLIAHGAEGL